jgi:hypothetical protein
MKKTRQVIAIALVTAALCADRAAVAAPVAVSAPVARMAVNLANRLSCRLRAGVATVVLQRASLVAPQATIRRADADRVIDVLPVEISPFQFRLPPPTL